jgi:pyruvate dehydrogenase E2 component (dihydrolipoamide acetyltransferase)
MISRIVLAKLSPTMEEGTVVKWNRSEGDAVKVGDVLAEIETDKANMEMEALGAGILRKILVPAGGKAPVGSLIGIIAEADEDIAAALAEAGPPPAVAVAAAAPAVATPAPGAPAAPAAAAPGRIKSSPLARKLAAQRSIPLASVVGTGPAGRIVKRDVEAQAGASALAAEPAPASALPAAVAPAPPAAAGDRAVPLSSMRKVVAKRLSESKLAAPHFYVTVEIDMGRAVELREQLARASEQKISFNDLVLKACAAALKRVPAVNASWAQDRIVYHGDVHLGVAVALEEGLITPVVRNADRKTLPEIAREVRDLAARAREKKLKPEDYSGSTFTISNLGMMDVSEFTAIINPPEAAILAVGSVRKVPVVVDEAVAVGHRMKVTLSSDHRVVDGAVAARFLGELRTLLENPVALLL